MDITLAGSAATYTPNDDQLGRVSIELAAFDGEVGSGILPVPDSAAALTVSTGRQAKVAEAGTVLTNGFIVDQDRVRGPEPASTAREYNFGIQDANALLGGFRVERTRSAETDYARVIAFAAADGPTWLTSWVLNSSTVTMPAKDYSDDGWQELITDLVEFTGKTLFLHDTTAGTRCLHYHVLTTGHTSGLTVSDVPSAVNGTTVFVPQTPTRQRTSVDLVNDVKGRDQAGRTSTATDATSIAAHDADGLKHQTLMDFEAGSQADLDAKTAAYLASQKDDLDTYSLAIGPLDSGMLSIIRVGDYIPVTSSVLGLTASSQRIAHMTLTPYSDGGPPAPGLWKATLELSAPVRRRARVKPVVRGVVISPGTTGAGDTCCPPWDGIGSPASGQEVLNELAWTGDGATTSGTTDFPYTAGTLQVWVAGLNVSGFKTEDNPATGAFSLSFAPTTGQTVRVNYIAV